MPVINHKGIELAYDDQGTGKPAFVFAHGWTCDRSFFAPQAAHFSPRHRVISVDLRGHGESDKPPGRYPITAYADDLAYIIDQLDLGKVVAVGQSMGGAVVLQLAATYPDRVAAIVMVDPAALEWPPDVLALLEGLVKAIEAGNQEPRGQAITRDLFLPTADQDVVEHVLSVMMSTPSHVASSALKGQLAWDGKAAAAQCKVPALHLGGTPPNNPPHLMSKWLPGVVNGWPVGSAHFSELEVPDQVNAMIEAFLHHYV